MYTSINVLVGDRGCGKTSVLANWVKQFKEEHPGIKLFSHYVGSSSTSTDIAAMMTRCTGEMREEYQNVDSKSGISLLPGDRWKILLFCL